MSTARAPSPGSNPNNESGKTKIARETVAPGSDPKSKGKMGCPTEPTDPMKIDSPATQTLGANAESSNSGPSKDARARTRPAQIVIQESPVTGSLGIRRVPPLVVRVNEEATSNDQEKRKNKGLRRRKEKHPLSLE